jgi:predicted nucleic-acid-binding protein
MRVAVDTNVLVRAVVQDDPQQATAAKKLLKSASLIAVSLPSLCEFVWVLRRAYSFDHATVAAAIRVLLNSTNVVANRPAVEAGLAQMDLGGDFADGVIAYEGAWLGGEVFVSFDKLAVTLLTARGEAARLLS